jgi:hypothetical protein
VVLRLQRPPDGPALFGNQRLKFLGGNVDDELWKRKSTGRRTKTDGWERGWMGMKTRLMIWTTLAFFWMGISAEDGKIFYFLAVHLLVCTVGLTLRRRETKMQAARKDPVPETASAKD